RRSFSSSGRVHTSFSRDWSSDVCSSDLVSDTDPSDKTEEATPERRRKARDEGQFPRSKDAGAVAASAAVLLCLLGMAPAIVSARSEERRVGDERSPRAPASLWAQSIG